jgi:hypothetical protein
MADKRNPDSAFPAAGKQKGRASVGKDALQKVAPTKRHTINEKMTQASRPVGAGAGIRRGNRRDTHPLFSTGKDARAGGKRGPTGRSTRKGGPPNERSAD